MRQAVILAGGRGTRLKQVSGDLPKPMVPILGEALLEHIVKQCAKYGILDIILLVSYKGDFIKKNLGDGSKYGVSITYVFEDTPKGTAGALIDALPKLDKKFFVLYGDTFFDIDFDRFWRFHNEKNSDVSIFLHPNDHPYDSDLVEIDSNCKVRKIHSYPHNGKWLQNLVNAAVYIFNRNSLKIVDSETMLSNPDIAKDLFPSMLRENKRLYGYTSTEYVKDMGTPERLLKVERDIVSGRVKSLRNDSLKAAVFLDRDGVINKEVGHLSNPSQFELIDGVGEAICRFNEAGLLVVVVTNQPVIARGDLTVELLKEIHNKMDTLLGEFGAYIDRLYYCPHHTDSGFSGEVKSLKFHCNCRKPNTGMFTQAAKDLNISLKDSWMVGDSFRDMIAAKKAGMHSILVNFLGSEYDKSNMEFDVELKDLDEASKFILKEGI